MEFIKENIDDDRLLSHDSKNRNYILEEHLKGNRPTVLLSPSMEEGVDLKNELSRFQIICKIPYPYLGDKLVKQRMKISIIFKRTFPLFQRSIVYRPILKIISHH